MSLSEQAQHHRAKGTKPPWRRLQLTSSVSRWNEFISTKAILLPLPTERVRLPAVQPLSQAAPLRWQVKSYDKKSRDSHRTFLRLQQKIWILSMERCRYGAARNAASHLHSSLN